MAIMVQSPYSHAHRANEDATAEVRIQIAVLRTLLDEVEQLVPPSGMQGSQRAASRQLAEELARLGCRMIELATEMATAEKPAH
ncbi:hypothetical protein LVJ94_01140 [Pendulispora rubella]|uniref:Uncharacterized protein n=1 Tax=Pendulispora rubella TaxID=2741070 RepID=A0ABZ2L540_9BACT